MKILLVDEEPTTRRIGTIGLKVAKHEVVLASTRRQAMASIRAPVRFALGSDSDLDELVKMHTGRGLMEGAARWLGATFRRGLEWRLRDPFFDLMVVFPRFFPPSFRALHADLFLHPAIYPCKRYPQFEDSLSRTAADPLAALLAMIARPADDRLRLAIEMQDFLPFQESVRKSLPPRGNTEENIERMVQQVRGTSQYKNRSK